MVRYGYWCLFCVFPADSGSKESEGGTRRQAASVTCNIVDAGLVVLRLRCRATRVVVEAESGYIPAAKGKKGQVGTGRASNHLDGNHGRWYRASENGGMSVSVSAAFSSCLLSCIGSRAAPITNRC